MEAAGISHSVRTCLLRVGRLPHTPLEGSFFKFNGVPAKKTITLEDCLQFEGVRLKFDEFVFKCLWVLVKGSMHSF